MTTDGINSSFHQSNYGRREISRQQRAVSKRLKEDAEEQARSDRERAKNGGLTSEEAERRFLERGY